MRIRSDDCSLTIKNLQDVEFRTPVVVKGNLSWNPLIERTIKRLNYWVNYSIEEESKTKQPRDLSEDLQILGTHLYNILFGDTDICDAFNEIYKKFQEKKKNDAGFRLRLKLFFDQEAKNLSVLPWEFLYMPSIPGREGKSGNFLVSEEVDLILTRFIQPSDAIKNFEARKEQLRILIVTAQPDGWGSVDINGIQELKTKLTENSGEKRIDVKVEYDLTLEKLKTKVEEFQPHILHFIGHGKDGMIVLIRDEEDQVYDIDKGGKQPHLVNNEELKQLFLIYKPRLIFLQACQGAAPNLAPEATLSVDRFKSAARVLVEADIPAVVAMQYSITNEDAKAFTKTVYEQLSQGKEVDEAVKVGRIKLGSTRRPYWGHPRFGTPVVYLQSDKAIIEFSDEEQENISAKIACPYAGCTSRVDRNGSRCNCPLKNPIPMPKESELVEPGRVLPKFPTGLSQPDSEGSRRDEVKQKDKKSPIDIRTNRPTQFF
jgi:CHAT domain